MSKQASIIVPEGCSRVLLHACCAPCSSAIVEWLLAHEVKPVIYYYNPNIYPYEEYEIRKNESKRHAASLGIEWIDDDRMSVDHYGEVHAVWRQAVKGLENEPERGRRCEACFYHRLFATARKAQELDIEYFATTLASSRWKDLDQVTEAGLRVCRDSSSLRSSVPEEHAVLFWPQNWRKGGLQPRRAEIIREQQFYNQTWCGCEFSHER